MFLFRSLSVPLRGYSCGRSLLYIRYKERFFYLPASSIPTCRHGHISACKVRTKFPKYLEGDFAVYQIYAYLISCSKKICTG